MPVTIPHAAMHAPKDLHDKYRKLFPQFENKIGKYAGPKVQNPIAAFAAMVEHLDSGIGRLMDTLKQLGIDDNTIVMFTSDNGPHLEGGHDPKFFDSNGPLRGFKRDLYEGGIRVPMIARWPGRIKANSKTDHISAFWDVMPTLCEITNTKTPEDIDGISFLPAMLGKKQKKHEYLFWEFHERGGRQAVRMGKWKGVRLKVAKNPNAPIELYNLDKDIAEENNIAEKHPKIVAKINETMKSARVHTDQWPLYKKK
jgi:arylsulfatase A-like enzyme